MISTMKAVLFHLNTSAPRRTPVTALHRLRLQSDLPLILLQPKFAQSNPRHNTSQHKHTRDNDRPVLDMRHVQTIRCPRRRANSRKP